MKSSVADIAGAILSYNEPKLWVNNWINVIIITKYWKDD